MDKWGIFKSIAKVDKTESILLLKALKCRFLKIFNLEVICSLWAHKQRRLQNYHKDV